MCTGLNSTKRVWQGNLYKTLLRGISVQRPAHVASNYVVGVRISYASQKETAMSCKHDYQLIATKNCKCGEVIAFCYRCSGCRREYSTTASHNCRSRK